VRQTFQIWTVMESIVAVTGLAGVLILSVFVAPPSSHAASKRVFYVNSYHEGYPPSDEAMGAIREILKSAGIETRVDFLDAKRSPDEGGLAERGLRIAAEIEAFRPNLVIVSDDDAVKYVVVPRFRAGPLPVVFCGVNWSADQYRLDPSRATGMLEVVPVEEAIRELRAAFPGARRLRVLSEDSVSERSNRELLDPKYRALGLEPSYSLVGNFEAWKNEFLRAQREADLIYLPTNGAIRGWEAQAARGWVRTHIAKPVFTCDDFMMPYAAFGLTKVAREQGEWAAKTALRILGGARPADIPIVRNRQTRCFVNPGLASRIGFSAPGSCAVCE
jgi:ABC-type uncharacterized transport system substrate-binding protein